MLKKVPGHAVYKGYRIFFPRANGGLYQNETFFGQMGKNPFITALYENNPPGDHRVVAKQGIQNLTAFLGKGERRRLKCQIIKGF